MPSERSALRIRSEYGKGVRWAEDAVDLGRSATSPGPRTQNRANGCVRMLSGPGHSEWSVAVPDGYSASPYGVCCGTRLEIPPTEVVRPAAVNPSSPLLRAASR